MYHTQRKPSRYTNLYVQAGGVSIYSARNKLFGQYWCLKHSPLIFIVSDCHNVTHPTLIKDIKTPCSTYLPEKHRNRLLLP